MPDQYDNHTTLARARMEQAANDAHAAYLRENFIPLVTEDPIPADLSQCRVIEPAPLGWPVVPWDLMERPVHIAAGGNDEKSGATKETAVRTPQRAAQLLRDDHPGDWPLFKAGDEFDAPWGRWKLSGTPDVPRVMGVYGEGPRPIFNVAGRWLNTDGGGATPDTLDHVWFIGLDLRGAASHTGLRLTRSSTGTRIVDCDISGFDDGIALVGHSGGDEWHHDIEIIRCIIHDNVADTKSQGLYARQVNGALVHGCVFYRNGWSDLIDPTMFSHNMYTSVTNENFVVVGNLFDNAGSQGLQLRCGGVVEDNLLLNNPIGCFFDKPVHMRRNVIARGRRMLPNEGAHGWGANFANGDGSVIEDNAILHAHSTNGKAMAFRDMTNVTGSGNVIHAWGEGRVQGDIILPDGFFQPYLGAEMDRVFTLDNYYFEAITRPRGWWNEAMSPATHAKWVLEGVRA